MNPTWLGSLRYLKFFHNLPNRDLFSKKPAIAAMAALFFGLTLSATIPLLSPPAQAATTIPYKINFQGRLTNAAGNTLADGLYNIKFRIMDASSGGTNLFEEARVITGTDNRVQVTNGLFSIQLGDLTSLASFDFTQTGRYIEVELPTPATATCATNGCAVFTEGAMTPRQPFGSSPYAFNADKLDGVDGASYARNDAANTFTTGDQAVNRTSTTAFQIQNASAAGDLFIANTTNTVIGIGAAPVTGAGADILQVTGSINTSVALEVGSNTSLSTTALTIGGVGICTSAGCTSSGAAATLQQGYNADADSADATLALTSTDGNLIFSNPSSGGVASGAVLKVDQLATGAVEGLRIESAGTGNLLTVRDTTATAQDVFKIADGGGLTQSLGSSALTYLAESRGTTPGTTLDAAWGVFVAGKYAYVANFFRDSLAVIDISNPASPTFIAETQGTTPGTTLDGAESVFVAGKYAYVANFNRDSLAVIDISNPASPTFIAETQGTTPGTTLDGATSVTVSGKYAYVANYARASLAVIDISNPASPTFIAETRGTTPGTTLNGANGVFVTGDYVYLANALRDSLAVIDISNPASPTFIAETRGTTPGTTLDSASSVSVAGKYAYVANYNRDSLAVIDISNPASPTFIAETQGTTPGTTLNGAFSVSVAGKYAYVANFDRDSLAVIDISNPASPTFIAETRGTTPGTTLDGANGVFVAGKYAYVVNIGRDSLAAIDLGGSDLATLSVGSVTTGSLSVESYATFASGIQTAGGLQVADSAVIQKGLTVQGSGTTSATSVMDVLNSAGASLLKVRDDGNVGIGTAAPGAALHVSSAGSGADLFKITDTTTTARDVLTIADGGATTFRNQTDSAAALQIQNAAGTSIFTADTSALKISTGNLESITPGSLAINNATTVDSTGNVGASSSVAMASDGFARISYFDGTNADLKFAQCTNAACTTKNLTTIDSTGLVGGSESPTALAIASDDFARIAYYDDTGDNLKFVQCTNAACSTNNITTIDSTGSVGFQPSLTLGSDGFARIAYHDITNTSLKFVQCTNAACSTSNITTVDNAATLGYTSSVKLASDGFARISYRDLANTSLKFAQCTNAACTTSNITTPDNTADVGFSTSLQIGSDDFARISYRDITNNDLKFAQCTNAACSTQVLTSVDSALSVAVAYTAMALGSDGFARISYYDAINDDLKFAQCTNAACSTKNILVLDSGGEVGLVPSIALGSDGFARISYYDTSNDDLKFIRLNTASGTEVITGSTLGTAAASYGQLYSKGINLQGSLAVDNANRTTPAISINGGTHYINAIDDNAQPIFSVSATQLLFNTSSSGGAFFQVDNTNGIYSSNTLGRSLIVESGGNFDALFVTRYAGTGNYITADTVFTVGNTGAALFQNSTNSTAAFQVQNTAGQNLFVADTVSQKVTINKGSLVITAALANPAAPSLSTSTSGGSLPDSTNYAYRLSALVGSNETAQIAASPTSVNTGGSGNAHKNTLNWSAVTGATSYKVYRSKAGGAWQVKSAGNVVTYDDTTDTGWTGSAALSSANTTGSLTIDQGTQLILDGNPTASTTSYLWSIAGNTTQLVNAAGGGGIELISDSLHFQNNIDYATNFSIDNTGAALFKNRTNSATAFVVQNAGAQGLLVVDTTAGTVKVTLGATASTNAVCSSLANATGPTAGTAYELRDCNAAPAADYAEDYPVASGITYGDIVATGTTMVNTYDTTDGNIDWNKLKGQVAQLVKSTSPYQASAIGIVSDNHGDFTSAGHNIKPEDNPMPVALNGRVPVNIASTSEAITPGDYLTTSTEPGKAMKATGSGFVIGKALGSWTPESGEGSVLVFVEPGYYNGPSITSVIQNGGTASLSGLSVSGMADFAELNTSGTATITRLSVTGSATINGNLVVQGLTHLQDLQIDGHIVTGGETPASVALAAAGAGATVSIEGNDISGTITILTGTNPTAGQLAKINFAKSYVSLPRIVLSPSNDSAGGLRYFKGDTTATDFILNAKDVPASHTSYRYDYFITK